MHALQDHFQKCFTGVNVKLLTISSNSDHETKHDLINVLHV